MKTIFIYPGSFCPPTNGHANLVKNIAQIFPEIYVVASVNPEKENLFSLSESRDLWQSYSLPENVKLLTIEELKNMNIDHGKIVMIRGVRNQSDFQFEKNVLFSNWRDFGIDKFFYYVSDCDYQRTSSSLTRKLARSLNLRQLAKHVSPLSVTALLEKTFSLNNLILVVGLPGSGKTTLLKKLANLNPKNRIILTDEFNKEFKFIIKKNFGDQNIIDLALNNEEELKKVVAAKWFDLLRKKLLLAKPGENVFVEIAYGLEANKQSFRYLGGKLLFLDCGEKSTNVQRLKKRGTPELTPFIDKIPDLMASKLISYKYRLQTHWLDTDCGLSDLERKAKQLNDILLKGDTTWKTYLPGWYSAI